MLYINNILDSLLKKKISIILLFCLTWFSCKDSGSPESLVQFPHKEYILDTNGRISSTEMSIDDFESAGVCKDCHFEHWKEWSESMHAYSMHDPVFFSGWNREQNKRLNTGERFCIQCHSPVAFVTGIYLDNIESHEELVDELFAIDNTNIIADGISCSFCHSVTGLSHTVHTNDQIAANAEYNLNPGENVYYASIENPQNNSHHNSEFNPIYKTSEICLPCHNLTVRGIEAEITFSEWDRIPGTAMGLFPCQECHMPLTTRPAADVCIDGPCPERQVHRHTFVGVGLDLTIPAEENPQYELVTELLNNAVELKFSTPDNFLTSNAIAGDSLEIPVTVTSLTAHSIPSGVSFAREAWLEVAITDNNDDTLYQSGVVMDAESLDITDSDLLLFTSFLFDENSVPVESITDISSMVNNSLMAFGERYKIYKVKIPNDTAGEITIRMRMRFRSFKPNMLRDSHSNLLENLSIFDMAIDSAVVTISP